MPDPADECRCMVPMPMSTWNLKRIWILNDDHPYTTKMAFVDGQTRLQTYYGVCRWTNNLLNSLWSLSRDRQRVKHTNDLWNNLIIWQRTDNACVAKWREDPSSSSSTFHDGIMLANNHGWTMDATGSPPPPPKLP